MERIISTTVEDAPKGVFLVALYDANERKDDDGNRIQCADLLRAYKKVNFFDVEGNMEVKYYTEAEWNDTEWQFGKDRQRGRFYHPAFLDHFIFLRHLNECLEYSTLHDVVEDIVKGNSLMTMEDLAPRSKELIEYVQKWDGKTPFDFNKNVYQTSEEEDDGTYYYVECFKFPK